MLLLFVTVGYGAYLINLPVVMLRTRREDGKRVVKKYAAADR